jgi:hypothetical protein
MTMDRAALPPPPLEPVPSRRQHVVAVIGNSYGDLRVVLAAGRLAATVQGSLTVAWLLRQPWGLALAAPVFTVPPPSTTDLEIETLLSVAHRLNPLAIPWQLEMVAYQPARAVAAIAGRQHTRAVVMGRRRVLGAGCTPWLAWCLRRRHGLPVQLVTPWAAAQEPELVP